MSIVDENFVHGLKIASLNVDGILSNLEKRKSINSWLIDNDIDLLCIQEWCKQSEHGWVQFPKNEFPDYTPFTNHTLGTAILYKSSLSVLRFINSIQS